MDTDMTVTKPQKNADQTVQINTTLGAITGLQRDGYQEFRGIPYAKPISPERRFKAPIPVEPWHDTLDATQFGNSCPQIPFAMFDVSNAGDDCLNLNIWTPAADNKKRPVMVWIHGGFYQIGSGSQLLYRGNHLAAHGDLVIVTINYRLGAYGFLHERVSPDHPNPSQGNDNNALRDQIMALEWVKSHIAHFGGDPNNVTLFGESAGGMAISCLLTSPLAKDLFQRAIIQSGSCDHVMTHADQTRVEQQLFDAAEIPMGDYNALAALPYNRMIAAQKACNNIIINRGNERQQVPQTGMPFMPLVGTEVLPELPAQALLNGVADDKVIMVGYTRDEWNLFLNLPNENGESVAKTKYKNLDKLGLIDLCERGLPSLGERAANIYEKACKKRNPDANYLDMYSAFETDRVFRISTLHIAEALHRKATDSSSETGAFVYSIHWDQGTYQACHIIDIPLVFGSSGRGLGKYLTGGDDNALRLSEQMQDSWIAFARSGNPATDSVGSWPVYSSQQRRVMVFSENTQLEDDPDGQCRELWSRIL